MNNCTFIGRFVKDPAIHTVNNGTKDIPVLNFTLAVSRKFKKGDGEIVKETAFVDCEMWDSASVLVADNFKKGDYILIYAIARTHLYEDGEKKVKKTYFRVEQFEFLPYYNKEE